MNRFRLNAWRVLNECYDTLTLYLEEGNHLFEDIEYAIEELERLELPDNFVNTEELVIKTRRFDQEIETQLLRWAELKMEIMKTEERMRSRKC